MKNLLALVTLVALGCTSADPCPETVQWLKEKDSILIELKRRDVWLDSLLTETHSRIKEKDSLNLALKRFNKMLVDEYPYIVGGKGVTITGTYPHYTITATTNPPQQDSISFPIPKTDTIK